MAKQQRNIASLIIKDAENRVVMEQSFSDLNRVGNILQRYGFYYAEGKPSWQHRLKMLTYEIGGETASVDRNNRNYPFHRS